MTFVHPFAWALLALLAVPVILYLLPMPRRRIEQPSLILWQRMLRDRPASQSWRWLQTLLSFLLVAVILVLLVFAVGKPVFTADAGESEATVVVLDVSASMTAPLAGENGRTRFDRAVELARGIISGMPSGNRAALVTAGAKPTVVSGLTDERAMLLERLDAVRPTEGRTDLAGALRLAVALARGEGDAEVTVVSDGAADVSDVAVEGVRVNYCAVGQTLPNVGIVDFDVRRSFELPEQYQALARIRNASPDEKVIRLTLSIDDNAVERRDVTLAPETTVSETFRGKLTGAAYLSLRFVGSDALAADDAAWAWLAAQKTGVVLVTETSDRFLESALTANRGLVTIPKNLEDYGKFLAAPTWTPDVFVLNRVVPEPLPAGNQMIVNPEKACTLFDLAEEAHDLPVTTWRREHPVLAGVTLEDVFVSSARPVTPKGKVEVLAASGDTALIMAIEDAGRRVVVLTFPPEKSSLTFRVAFPLIVANAVSWLTQDRQAPMTTVSAGGEFRAAAAGVTGDMTVTYPGGNVVTIAPEHGEFVVPTTQVGLYAMSFEGRSLLLAADLNDEAESNLEVAAVLTFADGEAAARTSDVAGLGEFWLYAALAAVLLMAVEWVLYHHRFVV